MAGHDYTYNMPKSRVERLKALDAQLDRDFRRSVDAIIADFEAKQHELQDLYKYRLDRTASTNKPTVCASQAFYGGDELDNFIDYTR